MKGLYKGTFFSYLYHKIKGELIITKPAIRTAVL